jgi:BirA family biotin operon repressor/biotin-[acetyl-CoA-carboxylase] ligase
MNRSLGMIIKLEDQIVIYNLGVVDSTQIIAKREILKLDTMQWYLWNATAQTSGQGRQCRSWLSPPNLSTYTTYGFCIPSSQKVEIFCVSQVAAYSTIETLIEFGIKDAKLKWPNDVLIDGKKISGSLVEVIQYNSNTNAILIGASINVNIPLADFHIIDQPATSMKALTNTQYDIPQVTKVFSKHLRHNIEIFFEEGFERFAMQINKKLHTFDGKIVSLRNDFGTYSGTIEGIDKEGALRLSGCPEIPHYNGTILKAKDLKD